MVSFELGISWWPVALRLCSVFCGGFSLDLAWNMAKSLREVLVDELLRLGLSMDLILLLLPTRGTAWNDVAGELTRVMRWLAGSIRDQLMGGHTVAAPDVVSQAVEGLVGRRPEPQPGPDLTVGPGGVAVPSAVRLPRYRKRRRGRKADQACAFAHLQGAGPDDQEGEDEDDPEEDQGQGPDGQDGGQGLEGPEEQQGPEGQDGGQGPQGPDGGQGPEGPDGGQGPEGPEEHQGPEGPE